MKKVMAFGTFDRLHPGHLNFLEQAKAVGDHLTVVVARDKNVQRFKGRSPNDNEEQRKKNVGKLGCVDRVVLGQQKNIYNVILRNNPDIICLGYDQRVDVSELKKVFRGKIMRLKGYKPEIHKTSKMVKKSKD